jgi:hypothetical protein
MSVDANGLKIKLDPKHEALLTNRGMNYAARLQKPFKFAPTSFTSSIHGLKPKSITRETQVKQLQEFLDEPFRPVTYCLVSAPNDGMAKLLAAYMMQHAVIHHRSTLPVWHDLTQSFKNSLIEDDVHASLIILNNVGSTSTPAKLEKLRDLLTHYADIPRIVVATGCDPFMFFTQHMFMPMNACAYMTTEQVKKSYEL